MINILADENMPYVQDLFGDFANIVFKNGREINPQDLIDIDVLLIRSITQVNETEFDLNITDEFLEEILENASEEELNFAIDAFIEDIDIETLEDLF